MSKGRSKGKSNGGNDHRRRRLWPFAVGVAVLGVCVALVQSNVSLGQQPAVPMQRPLVEYWVNFGRDTYSPGLKLFDTVAAAKAWLRRTRAGEDG